MKAGPSQVEIVKRDDLSAVGAGRGAFAEEIVPEATLTRRPILQVFLYLFVKLDFFSTWTLGDVVADEPFQHAARTSRPVLDGLLRYLDNRSHWYHHY